MAVKKTVKKTVKPVAKKNAAGKSSVKKAVTKKHTHVKPNIGIFFGGRSSEHEVSLVSAKSIIDSIDKNKYNVIPIGINKAGNFFYLEGSMEPAEILKHGKPALFVAQPNINYNLWILDEEENAVVDAFNIDIAFPVLHGPYGEDGKIQGLFEMANIPYVGSDVLGSACGMDKAIMKNLFINHNLPTTNYAYFTKFDFENSKSTILDTIKTAIKAPYFVKPANLGSSVGISKVAKFAGLTKAIEKALKYDYKIIVEEGVNAREIEVAVIGNFEFIAAEPGEVLPAADFYDYDDKYKNGKTKFAIPAKLPQKKIQEIKEMAVTAYESVGAKGFARVDLFLEKETGAVYVNEINTIPGFTSISMFPRMFEKSGVKYSDLVDKLIGYAVELHDLKSNLTV
ncbi:MAG TPA: D-alanine--D-alanine ligase family protein [Candidatus Wallbacteria bacterium]|nr:D-alanine--D-alanine ligase family protein [Candidatus Wallbacteria bacterium]